MTIRGSPAGIEKWLPALPELSIRRDDLAPDSYNVSRTVNIDLSRIITSLARFKANLRRSLSERMMPATIGNPTTSANLKKVKLCRSNSKLRFPTYDENPRIDSFGWLRRWCHTLKKHFGKFRLKRFEYTCSQVSDYLASDTLWHTVHQPTCLGHPLSNDIIFWNISRAFRTSQFCCRSKKNLGKKQGCLQNLFDQRLVDLNIAKIRQQVLENRNLGHFLALNKRNRFQSNMELYESEELQQTWKETPCNSFAKLLRRSAEEWRTLPTCYAKEKFTYLQIDLGQEKKLRSVPQSKIDCKSDSHRSQYQLTVFPKSDSANCSNANVEYAPHHSREEREIWTKTMF
jgi:hypothetical protein